MSEVKYGRGYVYAIQYHLVWCVKYRHKVLAKSGSTASGAGLSRAIKNPLAHIKKIGGQKKNMVDDIIVCYCSNVTKGEIVEAIRNGAKTLEDIRRVTSACTVGKCKELSPRKRCCSPDIIELIKQYSN